MRFETPEVGMFPTSSRESRSKELPLATLSPRGLDHLPAEFGDHASFALPSGLVAPNKVGNNKYKTREHLEICHQPRGAVMTSPRFGNKISQRSWSAAERDACNMCGYCGGFMCWGKHSPKSGVRLTTLKEIEDMSNVSIITDAKAIEGVVRSQTPGRLPASGFSISPIPIIQQSMTFGVRMSLCRVELCNPPAYSLCLDLPVVWAIVTIN